MLFDAKLVFLAAVQMTLLDAVEYPIGPNWDRPSRVRWCPVHRSFSIRQIGSDVELTQPSRGSFSLAETSVSLPASGTIGLRLRVSAPGSRMPSFWRFAIRPSDKVRFVYPVEVPSGGAQRTVFIPWTSFQGQKVRVGGVDQCVASVGECMFKVEDMNSLSVIFSRKGGIEAPSLVLHEVVATSSSNVPAPSPPNTSCSCDTDCVRCMYYDWAHLVSTSCTSSTTSDVCLRVRKSLAKQVLAGLRIQDGSCMASGAHDAVQWLASTMDVTNCMDGSSALPASVLGDVLQGIFTVSLPQSTGVCSQQSTFHANDFFGPVVGWGITGHNDLAVFRSVTSDSCLDKCRADSRCKSVDYGSRGSVQGECWLSTKNRNSAGSAYSGRWSLYDYYELVTAGSISVTAGSMSKDLSTQQRSNLLQGLIQGTDCCADPVRCMDKAIATGAPIYNVGDALGCFVIYHSTATQLAECVAGSSSRPDARGLMQATLKTSEMDAHPDHAAWRLRRAFDAYHGMMQTSYPSSPQCQQRTPRPAYVLGRTASQHMVYGMMGNTTSGIVASGLQGNAGATTASGTLDSVGHSGLWLILLPLKMLFV